MKETQIVYSAQKNFRENTGMEFKVKSIGKKSDDVDGQIILSDPNTGKTDTLFVEIKNEIRTHDLLQLKAYANRYKGLVLIAQYISKKNKEQLRSMNINYVESSGNCYISYRGWSIFWDNQKSAPMRKSATCKLFTYSGMKFIYALLLNPNMITKTYREIAVESEIALGSVGDIIQELATNGYLKQRAGEKQLVDLKDLFEDWVDYFDERMVPHLVQATYVFADKSSYVKWPELPTGNCSWGGEPAAYLMDHYLQPERFIIYSTDSPQNVMQQFRLIPHLRGDVTLMLPPLERRIMDKHADPFLIYAELMRSNDSRCHEAAQRVREKYIDQLL